MTVFSVNNMLETQLRKAKENGNYRYLTVRAGNVDFFSNDYLGFARSRKLRLIAENKLNQLNEKYINGSSGSRLISGNYEFGEQLEQKLASFYGSESGLIYNSGYDANVGLLSCLPKRNDTVLYDELSHASIRDGIRLSYAKSWSFRHNDLQHLKKLLATSCGNIFVVTESVFSMDGDIAPLNEIALLCEENGASLIVDEAHSNGIFGESGAGIVSEMGLENKVFARLFTFGKALGTHGGIIVGSNLLRKYLINFSRSFIYTTALPLHSLVLIDAAYEMLFSSIDKRKQLQNNLLAFDEFIKKIDIPFILTGKTPIKALLPGNISLVNKLSDELDSKGILVKGIKSPTVPLGKERLRIAIHSFNSEEEMKLLLETIKNCL